MYLAVGSRRAVIVVPPILAYSLALAKPRFDHPAAARRIRFALDADVVARFLVVEDVVGAKATEVVERSADPLGTVVVPLLSLLAFAPEYQMVRAISSMRDSVKFCIKVGREISQIVWDLVISFVYLDLRSGAVSCLYFGWEHTSFRIMRFLI